MLRVNQGLDVSHIIEAEGHYENISFAVCFHLHRLLSETPMGNK